MALGRGKTSEGLLGVDFLRSQTSAVLKAKERGPVAELVFRTMATGN